MNKFSYETIFTFKKANGESMTVAHHCRAKDAYEAKMMALIGFKHRSPEVVSCTRYFTDPKSYSVKVEYTTVNGKRTSATSCVVCQTEEAAALIAIRSFNALGSPEATIIKQL